LYVAEITDFVIAQLSIFKCRYLLDKRALIPPKPLLGRILSTTQLWSHAACVTSLRSLLPDLLQVHKFERQGFVRQSLSCLLRLFESASGEPTTPSHEYVRNQGSLFKVEGSLIFRIPSLKNHPSHHIYIGLVPHLLIQYPVRLPTG
jgi:hypothetical protein